MNDADSSPHSLRDRLALVLDESDPGLRERLTTDAGAYLELVALANQAKTEIGWLLEAAVASARGAGCTWEQIGAALGMTRQGAHYLYGKTYGEPVDAGDGPTGSTGQLLLSPLTAINEMKVLSRAGRYGWHSVGYGVLYHTLERDEHQWEHARASFGARPSGDGWNRVGAGWAWWSYWARRLDQPRLPGDPTAADLLHG